MAGAEELEFQNYLNYLHNERLNYTGESKAERNVYTPRSALERYFAQRPGAIEHVLRLVLKDEEHMIPSAASVLQEYIVVLTILIRIGQAHHLNRFIERDYNDDRLPFFDRPRHFPRSDSGSIFDAFFDVQWQYCPVKFSKSPINFQVEPEQILPLKSKELIGQDGPAARYKVELHEEYDPFLSDSAPFQFDLGISRNATHTYIFKEFPNSAKRSYDKELTVFLYLQKASQLLGKTIVGFYGSFVHDNTYTIILECPSYGSLDDFMLNTASPTTPEVILRLWEGLLSLHETLHTIHNMSPPYSEDVKEYSLLRGWHQRIGPQAIAVFSGQIGSACDCQFRINNLGVIYDGGSEDAYAAPECQRPGNGANLQLADVWSFGCVLSEFAVWLTLGLTSLKDYRTHRSDERAIQGLGETPAFHDGQRTLRSVAYWHEQVIGSKYPYDKVTKPILEQVVEETLCDDEDARPSTRQLKMKIRKILSRAREQHLADLNRYDSLASSNTGLSASNGSHLSHRTSTRSSSSQDSGVGYGVGVVGRMASSSTKRSLPLRDSQTSSYLIREEGEYSGPGSPISPQEYSRIPPRTRHLLHRSAEAPERIPPRKAVPFAPPNHEYRDDINSALINGEDKEISVSRGPPPVNLTRFLTASSERSDQTAAPVPTSPMIVSSRPNHVESLPAYTPTEILPDQDPRSRSWPMPPATNPSSLSPLPSTTLTARQPPAQNAASDAATHRSTSITSGQPSLSSSAGTQRAQHYKPYLSMIDGLIWLNNKKGTASNAVLPDESYLSPLADRDFVFLIDDSASMRLHREMTSRAVRMLSWLLKKYDKNGMDLYFMQKAGKTHARSGHSSDLQRPLLKTLDECTGRSNVNARLAQILQEYRDRNAAGSVVPQASKGPFGSKGSSKNVTGAKKIMIYVVTDGKWADDASTRLTDTMSPIASTLASQGAPDQAVGIQFIRTEETPAAITYLSGLKQQDFANRIKVDSHPLEGNVFRLLLGPITDLWDNEDEETQTISSA